MTKTIVVTGSTRGIGFGLAHEFLQRGCRVFINGRTQSAVDQAVNDLAGRHGLDRVGGSPADMTVYDQVQSLWDRSIKRFSQVDIWINNAGVAHPDVEFWKLPVAEIDKTVGINLIGLMYASRVAINGLLTQGGGYLYNMYGFGSTGRYRNGMSIYGSTKRAVNYFTEALVKELANQPVKVGSLSPGMVVTDLVSEQYKERPQDFQRAKDAFNLLGDRVETVTPWLADRVLSTDRTGANIQWLTPGKLFSRLLLSRFKQRDYSRSHSA